MIDRIVCTRCGQDGHRAGHCPWPAETLAQGAPRQLGGVRTVADLMDRCVVDEITGCWHWRGSLDSNLTPTLYLPAVRHSVSLGVAICHLLTGAPPKRGVVWHCTCETSGCANPEHRRAGNRSSQMRAAKVQRSPVTKAKIAAAKRAKSKLAQADVDAIRGSSMTLAEICERYGICTTYACEIRAGKRRAPLAAPGSSVFALGGWA